jgi:transcriptional regulator with XRE-family HTH domain
MLEPVIFPNNIRQVRERRGVPMGKVATALGLKLNQMSKVELGHRKLKEPDLEKVAEMLEVKPDELIIDVSEVKPTPRQLHEMEQAVVKGQTAAACVLWELRRRAGKGMQAACDAAGIGLATYYRLEMGKTALEEDVRKKLAKLFGARDDEVAQRIEALRLEHVERFEKGATFQELLPREPKAVKLASGATVAVVEDKPRPAVKRVRDDGEGALGVAVISGRSRDVEVPVYGELRDGRFVFDRGSPHGKAKLPAEVKPVGEAFAVANHSERLLMCCPKGSTVFCDRGTPGFQDMVVVVRRDGSADVAFLVNYHLDKGLQMLGPDEVIPARGEEIADIYRVRAMVWPQRD